MIFESIIASLCCVAFQQREWYTITAMYKVVMALDLDLDGNVVGETHLGGPLTVAGGGREEKAGEGEQTIVLLCLAFNRFHL